MPQKKCNAKAQRLQQFLEQQATTAGRLSRFVQRQSKMTGACFAQVLIIGWMRKPEATLNELAQASHDLGVTISAPGLHQRINGRAVAFLQVLFAAAIAWFRSTQPLPEHALQQFSAIHLLDSTIITLPAALCKWFASSGTPGAEAGLKVQLSFDYLHGQMDAVAVTAAKQPDQNCSLDLKVARNSLHLFDLGYFAFPRFTALVQCGAFFLCRFKTETRFYASETAQEPLDWAAFLAQTNEDRIEAQWFMGRDCRLPVRVCFERLPQAVAEERRRKAKDKARDKGRTYSKRFMDLLDWSFLMTNVPVERLSFDQVFVLYRVRWHIELLFKLWKSQAKLAMVGQMRLERVVCQLYARLIALILFQWLVAPLRVVDNVEMSLPKAFQVLQRHALRLLDSIAQGWHTTHHVLVALEQAFVRFARKDKRKQVPSTYQRLRALSA
jgi:hypothetical protein